MPSKIQFCVLSMKNEDHQLSAHTLILMFPILSRQGFSDEAEETVPKQVWPLAFHSRSQIFFASLCEGCARIPQCLRLDSGTNDMQSLPSIYMVEKASVRHGVHNRY